MSLARIAEIAAGEAERQGAGLTGLVRLLDAYQWARTHSGAHNKHWPVDARVRELGWIHPWKDGNGRIMWIVRTRLTDTWDNPEPLPDYDYTPDLK